MASSAPSQRQLRVGEIIRHALAEVFSRNDTNDPDLDRLGVTVVEVQTSPDLRIATAYVRPFMEKDNDTLMQALERTRLAGLPYRTANVCWDIKCCIVVHVFLNKALS